MTKIASSSILAVIIGVLSAFALAGPARAQRVRNVGTVTVHITQHPKTFSPDRAFGVGADGLEKNDIAQVYTPANVRAMRSAGLRPLSYRLRTELGIEAWHWNPQGAWSDPVNRQGYWTSSDRADAPIMVCNGYSLPRRGNTIDQAGNRGYSRLDDGDPASFWKSNPYLDAHYTGESNVLHPQWIVADFGKRVNVNEARILWETPYATRYRVEYWDGVDPKNINDKADGAWRAFPNGVVEQGRGGAANLRLCPDTVSVRYVRIMMYESCGIAPAGSTDVRDGLGYAVAELYIGETDAGGAFHDLIRHGKKRDEQTNLFVSSTDPWHRWTDKDPNVEQPGFDRILRSGLTNGLPMMTPAPVLYDTPENAAAEIRYFKWRGWPIRQVEMGEEPDGQYVLPEDYAALYLQVAKAIHAVDKSIQLGGPALQTDINGWTAWEDKDGNRAWMKRFVNYLRAHKRLRDFNFFSFEWYPFDNINSPTGPQLASGPERLARILKILDDDGVPRSIPWMITEFGYSAFACQAEVEMPGAIMNSEIQAQFLELGGAATYLYGYEPGGIMNESSAGATWGNLIMFLATDERRIRCPLPTYYAARMMTQEWTLPGAGAHSLYSASSDICDKDGRFLVTAYAVRRPDGEYALLLLNKDPKNAWNVRVRFNNASGKATRFQGSVASVQYSSEQYIWKPDGKRGFPDAQSSASEVGRPRYANDAVPAAALLHDGVARKSSGIFRCRPESVLRIIALCDSRTAQSQRR